MKQPETNQDGILSALKTFTRPWSKIQDPHQLELRFLCEGGRPEVQHFSTTELERAAEYSNAANKNGKNAYFCPNPVMAGIGRPAKDTDIVAAIWCFADADTPRAAQAILEFESPAPDALVVTGTKPSLRLHGYWDLEHPVYDLTDWRRLQKRIAMALHSDGAVINPSRIMRLPFSVAWPSEAKRARGYAPELVQILSHADIVRS
ncbi:hypothetical protein [Roseovarius sp.]|uniref:hypothetical protein n=1 Tax=Roseovarius sp. TaxID=1486281 RepID=UPI003B5CB2BF